MKTTFTQNLFLMAYAVKAGMALKSLRDSNFDSCSAIGEVIDNSIQAGAKNITINWKEERSGKLDMLIFSDDGYGMDRHTIENCLSLGYSSRYDDRKGIGRFGVGMTLGAIHECKRIEVYSKSATSDWYYTYLDLDELENSDVAELPQPTSKKPSATLLADSQIIDHGTIVIWSNLDRLKFSKDFKDDLTFYLGRTFRKFIQGRSSWYRGQLSITLNRTNIYAWDPLFHFKEITEFPNDEKSELFPENKIQFEFIDEKSGQRNLSQIIINMSLLPFSLRKKRSGGGTADGMKNRKIDYNEGISILRNDREVYFGDPGYGTYYSNSEADKNKTRYIGCEISFTAELDSQFSVKNIKTGAKPEGELKKLIAENIKPTFKTQFDRIKSDWDIEEIQNRKNEEIKGQILPDQKHEKAVTLIGKTDIQADLKEPKYQTEWPEFAKNIYGDNLPSTLDELKSALQAYGVIIVEEQFPGDDFYAIGYSNKIRKITFNTGSTFYRSYSQILGEISSENEELAKNVRVLIDLLLCGFVLSIDSISESEEFKWETGKRKLKYYWTEFTSKLFKEWQNNQ